MKAAHRFKQALREDRPVAVINADYANASLVEFLSRPELGVDAVMLDAEQGSPDFERIEDMARAARLSGVCVLVRLFSPEAWVIERMLLRGIDGVIVPRLDTAAQARAALDVLRYCHPHNADDKVFVVQIESAPRTLISTTSSPSTASTRISSARWTCRAAWDTRVTTRYRLCRPRWTTSCNAPAQRVEP